MRRKTTRTVLFIGIMVLAMAFAATSYAKIVVLSYTFDNDAQGFTTNIQGSAGNCNATATTSWSNGTLAVTLPAASGCNGYRLSINKIVVLASPIPMPNDHMAIRDDGGALNLSGASVSLSSIASPSKLVVLSPTQVGGWTSLNGSWSEQANSGSATLQVVIPFSSASWSNTMVIYVDNVELDSN